MLIAAALDENAGENYTWCFFISNEQRTIIFYWSFLLLRGTNGRLGSVLLSWKLFTTIYSIIHTPWDVLGFLDELLRS